MMALAARPGTSNEPGIDWNNLLVAAIEKHPDVALINVCVDGIEHEHKWIVEILTNFLDGKSTFTATKDINHTGKALKRACLTASSVKKLGDVYIDPSLFFLCNPKVARDLFITRDFASDALVLGLCHPDVIEKLMDTGVSDQSAAAIALYLFFVRILISATNSTSLTRRQRVAMCWSGFLFMSSIKGINRKTLLNLTVHVIGSLFIFVRSEVVRPWLTSEEFVEHYIGLLRQADKEFNMRSFCEFTDRAMAYWDAIFRSRLNVGGRSCKGYMATLRSFTDAIAVRPAALASAAATAAKRACIDDIRDIPARFNEDDDMSLSAQLFIMIKPIINQVCEDVMPLLKAFGVVGGGSRFARKFNSYGDFVQTFKDFIANVPFVDDVEEEEDDEEDENDDLQDALAGLAERMQTALKIDDTPEDAEFEVPAPETVAANATADEHQGDATQELIDINYETFMGMLRAVNVISQDGPGYNLRGVVSMATSCLRAIDPSTAKQSARSVSHRHQSLLGRWMSRKPCISEEVRSQTEPVSSWILSERVVLVVLCIGEGHACSSWAPVRNEYRHLHGAGMFQAKRDHVRADASAPIPGVGWEEACGKE